LRVSTLSRHPRFTEHGRRCLAYRGVLQFLAIRMPLHVIPIGPAA
jgi:hypothetical protein